MNKQELIKHFEEMEYVSISQMGKKSFIDMIEQLDEPQKPVVPQFVADYIEESRLKGWDLLASMCFVLNAKNKKTTKWFYLGENKNIFALAWINGYEVEKEKRFLVKMKGIEENINCLNYDYSESEWHLADEVSNSSIRTHHTRKELEDAGFGDVFNSPLFEVEEVEG